MFLSILLDNKKLTQTTLYTSISSIKTGPHSYCRNNTLRNHYATDMLCTVYQAILITAKYSWSLTFRSQFSRHCCCSWSYENVTLLYITSSPSCLLRLRCKVQDAPSSWKSTAAQVCSFIIQLFLANIVLLLSNAVVYQRERGKRETDRQTDRQTDRECHTSRELLKTSNSFMVSGLIYT